MWKERITSYGKVIVHLQAAGPSQHHRSLLLVIELCLHWNGAGLMHAILGVRMLREVGETRQPLSFRLSAVSA